MPVAGKQVRVLTLNKDDNRQAVLYRLTKGWTLRFVIGPSLLSATIRLFCNQPPDKKSFCRTTYYEIPWQSPSGVKSDRHDMSCEVHITIAGSFNYYFTIDGSENPDNANGLGYFLVDPTLHVGVNNEEITLDCVQCQTVVTKLLGPFPQWEGRLKVAKETGYNLIHFTPVQELGISNSAYSIRDQRHLSPVYSDKKKYTYADVELLVNKMKNEWQVLSLTDLVFNHTSKDSPWILEHPECGFNMDNSAHLKPAYIMDRIFCQFSDEVANGKWRVKGVSTNIDNEGQLEHIRHVLAAQVFPRYKLHEFYCVNVDKVMADFKKGIENSTSIPEGNDSLVIVQDPNYQRLHSTVNMNTALRIYNIDRADQQAQNKDRPHVANRTDRIAKCCEIFRIKLNDMNEAKERELQDHINCAIGNFLANVRWRFLDFHGPKLGTVTEENVLMHGYFAWPDSHNGSADMAEQKLNAGEGRYVMAVNGWVMNYDPLKNFAEKGSDIYLRRELVAWGDSVKLRYGDKPEDCPYLWQHMKDYSTTTAKIFHGIRLDNCHGTPIHVAEYMMDAARVVRPDLYVIAELFTGGEHIDNLFINRLGINSLIREALQAPDAHEEGRLVHRYGGIPVGSFVQPPVMPLVPTVAHAIFFDQTHDNESAIGNRSAYDLWPTSALISMACCASGSTRGYDQMVPHMVHVVEEKRLYTSWADFEDPESSCVNASFGITAGKKALNELHYEMGINGFSQVYVDQLDGNVVSVTRHNPQTHESIVLVARTSFQNPGNPDDTGYIRPIIVQGIIEDILIEGRMRKADGFSYNEDAYYINGLPDYILELQEHLKISDSKMVNIVPKEGAITEVSFHTFTPGSVVAFRSSLPPEGKKGILEIRRALGQYAQQSKSSEADKTHFRGIVSELSFADLNYVLYRTDNEEQDDGNGFGAYNIPRFGSMIYCGLRGVMSLLAEIRPHNDLGHPLCGTLRDGDWLLDYVADRLIVHPGTQNLGNWFKLVFSHLKNVPRYLVPCYFDAIMTGAYFIIQDGVTEQMSSFICNGSTFAKALSMGSVQFVGFVKTSKLPPLSPFLTQPEVRKEINQKTGKEEQAPLSLAAGFPHFACGYMRNWGRDTFISLRGLLLLTGRHEEARCIILSFAGTLRHGLIPNLLNEGTGARFNCRDAVWWWLQAIKEYTKLAPGGMVILKEKVSRLYPTDESPAEPAGKHDQPLMEVMQEALTKHGAGIKFRERNAGFSIDSQMNSEGFNVEAGVKWDTGFVYGGNEHNCGTWMDKMGSSEKAGNKGKPSTPRDGSAVELVGLSYSILSWLAELHGAGTFPYHGVTGKNGNTSYKDWAELIKKNFEKCFWISKTPSSDETSPDLVNRRQIYKDLYLATQAWTDFQLRPNFPITMVVAPDLFDAKHAWAALETAGDVLLGPLGMKTLDPKDWAYFGDYHSGNDSSDPKVGSGANYHQGPEWVWPVGFFLRAKLYFATILDKSQRGLLKETVCYVENVLSKHYEEVMTSQWQSLPELTNSDGSYCQSGCRAQAWSAACILDVLYDLQQVNRLLS